MHCFATKILLSLEHFYILGTHVLQWCMQVKEASPVACQPQTTSATKSSEASASASVWPTLPPLVDSFAVVKVAGGAGEVNQWTSCVEFFHSFDEVPANGDRTAAPPSGLADLCSAQLRRKIDPVDWRAAEHAAISFSEETSALESLGRRQEAFMSNAEATELLLTSLLLYDQSSTVIFGWCKRMGFIVTHRQAVPDRSHYWFRGSAGGCISALVLCSLCLSA
eukprot:SAG31_NODE_2885_length_4953_cov_4.633498_3_plen_223_part_00